MGETSSVTPGLRKGSKSFQLAYEISIKFAHNNERVREECERKNKRGTFFQNGLLRIKRKTNKKERELDREPGRVDASSGSVVN